MAVPGSGWVCCVVTTSASSVYSECTRASAVWSVQGVRPAVQHLGVCVWCAAICFSMLHGPLFSVCVWAGYCAVAGVATCTVYVGEACTLGSCVPVVCE